MTPEETKKLIREELQAIFGIDKYIFSKLIQIMDGRNIVVGKGVGTKIGTEVTQKLGFFGKTPIVQVSAIGSASGEDAAIINAIRNALKNLGLTQ